MGARRPARSRYLRAGMALAVVVALLGWLLNLWIAEPEYVPLSVVARQPAGEAEIGQLFPLAVSHMQRREYQQALEVWHRILLIDPQIAEVKVNMGFTLYELQRFRAARDFFESAVEQNPFQANAYYGLALISEQGGDIERAMGEMRTYIHLAGDSEEQRFVRRARSALWEWEAERENRRAAEDSAEAR